MIGHGSRSSYYKLSDIALQTFDFLDAADGLAHDNTTITTLLITTNTPVKYPYEPLLQDTCDNLNPLAEEEATYQCCSRGGVKCTNMPG